MWREVLEALRRQAAPIVNLPIGPRFEIALTRNLSQPWGYTELLARGRTTSTVETVIVEADARIAVPADSVYRVVFWIVGGFRAIAAGETCTVTKVEGAVRYDDGTETAASVAINRSTTSRYLKLISRTVTVEPLKQRANIDRVTVRIYGYSASGGTCEAVIVRTGSAVSLVAFKAVK